MCVYWLTGVGPAQGSNAKRVEQFEASNAVNAITLRPMEVGTLTEVLELVQQAQKLNWGIVVSGAVAGGKHCVGKAPCSQQLSWLAGLRRAVCNTRSW